MHLASFLDSRLIQFEHRILSKDQVYQNLVETICRHHKLPFCGRELLDEVFKREEQSSTAYPTGIAIPHVRMEGFDDTLIAITFLQNPIRSNGTEVSWVVLIITDKSSSKTYLNIVAALLGISKNKELMSSLFAQNDGHGVVQTIKKAGIEVKKDLTIADIMVSNPVSIRPEELLSRLSQLMSEKEISMVPVTDAENNYLGEVNILNFLRVGVPDYLMMLDNLNFLLSFEPLEKLFETQDVMKVGEIMVVDEHIISPEASIVEAVVEMIRHHKRYLSVVLEGKLVGVVTAQDIFRKVITV